VTLEEIARIAGVSRSTVSRVVNGDRRVSDAARARVQKVIRDHDYHPHAAARSLASRRMRVLGLLVSKPVGGLFTDPFYPILIQGTAEACNAADHTLTMLMDTSADGHAVDQLYGRVIRGRHVDGVILACQTVDDPLVPRLQADGIPFVLVGRHPGAQVSFVDVDSRGAAQGAVTHLLGHGYRRIAMICGQPHLIASVDRHAGYVAALQEAAVTPEPTRVVFADFTQRGGHRAMQRLLQNGTEIPEAIFAASDALAFGAMAAIQEVGLSVPGDAVAYRRPKSRSRAAVLAHAADPAPVMRLRNCQCRASGRRCGGCSGPLAGLETARMRQRNVHRADYRNVEIVLEAAVSRSRQVHNLP
jgi:LacI family transcriptional regulator